jgi:homoserine kinase
MENNIQENKVDIQKAPPLGGGGASALLFLPRQLLPMWFADLTCLGFAVNAPGDEVIMRVTKNRALPSAKLPVMMVACQWTRLRTLSA